MRHDWRWMAAATLLVGTLPPASAVAQAVDGPYARIAVLHPREGHTADFEAGYARHLEWHRQAGDRWVWYGWRLWASERQWSFVYATFGHSAASLASPVAPAEDEQDNLRNVAPHVDQWANAVYEFLPALSRGTGVPAPAARLELTTVDLVPGAGKAFETAIGAGKAALQSETLWYRMVAGGALPRYVRLRPQPSLSAILEGRSAQALPDGVDALLARTAVEILALRPTLSLGLPPAGGP